jgi:hypothetical protein
VDAWVRLCHHYKGINPSQSFYAIYEKVFIIKVTEAACSDVQHALCWGRSTKVGNLMVRQLIEKNYWLYINIREDYRVHASHSYVPYFRGWFLTSTHIVRFI